jgi:N utilization substance protein A
VRLASQLTGWRLDVVGESKFRMMEEEAISALASIERLDRGLALTLYKAGFRTLDEVAEASEQELGGIEGLGGPTNAASLKKRSQEAMERQRAKRVEEAARGERLLNDRDLLALLPGVTARVADLLHHAGYKSADDIEAEQDIDRLAIRTGLGSRRAQELREAIKVYRERDAEGVMEGQVKAREEAEAQARAEAEAQRRAVAAAAATAAAAAAAAAEPEAAKPSGAEGG